MAATYSVDGQSFGSIGEVESYLSGQGYDSYTIDDRRQGGMGRQSGVGMGEGAGLLGGAGGGGLFGGGGGGLFAPGGLFGASASPAAAATGQTFMGYGYTDPATGRWVSPGMDMRDGGGKGRAGDTFQGGPFSGLLNTVGVRPAGYRQRLEGNLAPQTSLRPQMRPAGLLGGSGGTQAAVDAALAAAAVGDTSAAVPEGFGQEFLDQPARLMPQNYFNERLASGLAQENITPVGQPMTGSELMEMARYMDQARRRREANAAAKQLPAAPSYMTDAPSGLEVPLDPEFEPFGVGQSARYEPDMGRRFYGLIQDPIGARYRLPSVDTTSYRPSPPPPTAVDDFRSRMGLGPGVFGY